MQLCLPLARRNSVVSLLVRCTLSDSVSTIMPFSAGVEQAATSDRAPATSIRQMRQAPVGVQPFKWHRVGMWMPLLSATSRRVWPGVNPTCRPFNVSVLPSIKLSSIRS